MEPFGNKVIAFNSNLHLDEDLLPEGIRVLNPFQGEGSEQILKVSGQFYSRFYNDREERSLILGINPGRLGAGATGIPFTDTKRLESHCGITTDFQLHEPSSVFVYKVIDAYGGPESFYSTFYIGSVCPLGFVKMNNKGNLVNYNYYDDAALTEAVEPFILESIRTQLEFGLKTDRVFCLGTGKNAKYLKALNKKHALFGEVIPLEHPRYVMQYKSKSMDQYVEKFIHLLG